MSITELLNSCKEIFNAVIDWMIIILSFDHPLLSIPTYMTIAAIAIKLVKKISKGP